MDRLRILVLGGCVGLGWVASPAAEAQSASRERNVTVTGPGGKTIERHLSATRSGGHVDRQLSISRPGGTLERSVHASAAPPTPPPRARGSVPHHHGGWYGPPPRSGPDPLLSFGLGALGGALTGAAVAAPIARMAAPPPVVVASPPVMVVGPPVVAAPPMVVVEQPAVVVEQPAIVAAPAVDPLDPVALAAQRLQSYHGGTRRDAAESLGLLGDPRGVPPLVDALRNDWTTSVRVAAATALGRIGGPEAEAVLGRAVVYEKKDSVRDAAAQALHVARAKAAAVVVAAPTETIVESREFVEPRVVERPSRAVVPEPPSPRPPAWEPSGSSRPAPIPLEAPALNEPRG